MPQRPSLHRVPWHRSRVERERHRKAAFDKHREGAAARGYDADWQRLRALYLKRYPLCSEPGCYAAATDVDHLLSVRQYPELRLVWSSLRSFCHRHHSARTARDQGFARPR
jgi:5-methylcytosine-specific restriction enzyme A